MNIKKYLKFWIPVLVLLLVTVLVIIKMGTPQPSEVILIDDISQSDWILGNPDAKIILIEYSDFQCPACAAFHALTKEIVGEFGEHIAFSYRHFPLPTHDIATLAAQASEAAGLQGQFWEMSDMIFANQQAWSSAGKTGAEEEFIKYAETLGLDLEKFKQDIHSKEVINAVEQDFISGQKNEIEYTPSFFLNGELINNPRSYDDFRTLIRNAIQAI